MAVESSTPNTIIIGADSLLGFGLLRRLQQTGMRVFGTTRRSHVSDGSYIHLDLAADLNAWSPPFSVSVAVICAGVTKIDACERDPILTAGINVKGVFAVAKRLARAGAFIIYLSSSAVFDGTKPKRRPDEPVSPVTEYGRQKAEVERLLLGLGAGVSILRLTKVLKPRTELLSGWRESLAREEAIHPFKDMMMSPVPLSFVIDVLRLLVTMRLPHIMQASGSFDVTYAEAAYHIARGIKAAPELVQPISFRDVGIPPEAAPANTTLDTTRLRAELGLEPPDVWKTITSAT